MLAAAGVLAATRMLALTRMLVAWIGFLLASPEALADYLHPRLPQSQHLVVSAVNVQ
jgi:hypothetical protein